MPLTWRTKRILEDKKTMIEDMFVSILNDLEGIILIQNQDEKEGRHVLQRGKWEKLLILSDKGGSAPLPAIFPIRSRT